VTVERLPTIGAIGTGFAFKRRAVGAQCRLIARRMLILWAAGSRLPRCEQLVGITRGTQKWRIAVGDASQRNREGNGGLPLRFDWILASALAFGFSQSSQSPIKSRQPLRRYCS